MEKVAIFILPFLLFECHPPGFYEQGNGKRVNETFQVENFSKLTIGGAYHIILGKGDKNLVIIDTDENLIKYIDVEVVGKTLYISNDNYVLKSNKGNEIVVVYNEIEEILINGACKLRNEGVLETKFLSVIMGGAGLIELEVDTKELFIEISGAGAVVLSGSSDYQSVHLSGAGGYDGKELFSKTCDVRISGMGGAEIYVEEKLNAQISGLGGVRYQGEPEDISTEISGLGTVVNAE